MIGTIKDDSKDITNDNRVFPVYVIYGKKTKSYPGKFVLRKMKVKEGEGLPYSSGKRVKVSQSLEDLRKKVPRNCDKLTINGRALEVWL